MTVLSVAYIGSNANSMRNLAHGLQTYTWAAPAGAPALDRDSQYLLLVNQFSGGSPRVSLPAFLEGTVRAVLCRITTAPYTGHSPHWGDELVANRVLYPQRFGIEALMTVNRLNMDDPLLPPGTADAIRRSGIQRGFLMPVPTSQAHIDAFINLLMTPQAQNPEVEPGAEPLVQQVDVRQARGAGRVNDPVRRKATERYAVERALAYLAHLGYTHLRELGAPYDLEGELHGVTVHVEVKGTSGAGGVVELTRNEVSHHRQRAGGMLIVVHDIVYNGQTQTCSGGYLRAYHQWQPLAEHLTPTRFEYAVPQQADYEEKGR